MEEDEGSWSSVAVPYLLPHGNPTMPRWPIALPRHILLGYIVYEQAVPCCCSITAVPWCISWQGPWHRRTIGVACFHDGLRRQIYGKATAYHGNSMGSHDVPRPMTLPMHVMACHGGPWQCHGRPWHGKAMRGQGHMTCREKVNCNNILDWTQATPIIIYDNMPQRYLALKKHRLDTRTVSYVPGGVTYTNQ